MSRIQNIGFQLKQSLRAMAAFGESKKAYKEETSRLRTEYKNRLLSQGYSKKDAHKMAQSICTYRDKIFSQSTLSAYQKAAGVFEQFCQETLGTKRPDTWRSQKSCAGICWLEYLKRSDTADGSSSFERNLQGLEAEYFRLRKADSALRRCNPKHKISAEWRL